MRKLLLLLGIILTVCGYAQTGFSYTHNFGKVKDWNNPTYELIYTNHTGKTIYFLPTPYSQDIQVSFSQHKLEVGESTTLIFQYYTEQLGRFSKDIKLYISTQNEPLLIHLSGHILSFHPQAYLSCPSFEHFEEEPLFHHTIKVVDATTGAALTDYTIDVQTATSQERIVSDKSSIVLKRERPSLYTFTVKKNGYESAVLDRYIHKNAPETRIALTLLRENTPSQIVLKENERDLLDTSAIDFKLTEIGDTMHDQEVTINELPCWCPDSNYSAQEHSAYQQYNP